MGRNRRYVTIVDRLDTHYTDCTPKEMRKRMEEEERFRKRTEGIFIFSTIIMVFVVMIILEAIFKF